jgi:phosphatidylglycerophosphate synthase
LAEAKVSVPVSSLAKWKTGVQIVALCFLLLGNVVDNLLPAGELGAVGLWIAAVLTLYTGYDYMRVGLRHMTEPDSKQ